MIDSHIHLYAIEFDADRDLLIKEALDQNVSTFLMPNIDEHSIDSMMCLVKEHAGVCLPMLGLHPCYVKENYEQVLQKMYLLFEQYQFFAIGETGIDLYWDTTTKAQQIEAFKIQLNWAKEKNLPIVIHSRNSTEEILLQIEKDGAPSAGGIFHCFSGNKDQALRCINLGFLLGIGGVVTFKKAGLDVLVQDIDMQHLILETDAPYLAPAPYRGKRNIPVYINLVAEKLAQIKGISKEECMHLTRSNAIRLFKLNHLND
ncbi:MAG TPA: TatD family hydrolase [Bacteroidia bacterium]|nr:TatD family hydrolase [Bacteroidia bacterium]HNT79126.1 TatD family hydrolase [Bacteroidia bacterium]